jgi:hypothetical protein
MVSRRTPTRADPLMSAVAANSTPGTTRKPSESRILENSNRSCTTSATITKVVSGVSP